jgi:hypothetical protein
MKTTTLIIVTTASVLMLALGAANAAKKNEPEPVSLTAHGEAHLKEYAAKLESLKAEVIKALPKIDPAKKEAYLKARAAEVAAVAQHTRYRKGAYQISEWKRHINDFHVKWIPMSEESLEKAKEAAKAAKTAEEKEAAAAAVAKAEKNLEKDKAGLQKRHDNLKRDTALYPNAEEELKKAAIAQPKAEAATMAAFKDLGLAKTLGSDKLDHKLAAIQIISHATPRGLAVYTQQGATHKKLIDELLADGELMVEICVADGAQDGNYGKAMEILRDIRAASNKSRTDPTLKNLALGMAIELATPRPLRPAKADTSSPEFVDPVKRYLAYEKAYLGKELDPCFDDLTVWEMRWVVNGEEPDHLAAWAREMLANYRPDHILTEDERWRYVDLVRTDIRYGSQDVKHDQDDLQFFQNILKNGGICGRRAFMGRFLLRSFGVPVTGRPQPGHAALTHYTSEGWVVCLGAGWGKGGTHTPYKSDFDFVATTQARATGEDYLPIARAHWIGSAHGEPRFYGFLTHRDAEIPFWNAMALYTQRDLNQKNEAKALEAVGQDIAEANVTKEKVEIIQVQLSDEDRKVKVNNGIITIPAAATSNLTESTKKVIFMPSNQGGLQMHYSRGGDPQALEYTFEAPKAGKYELTAKLVTPSWKQNLRISANGAEPVKLEMPHTNGMWDTTAPVTLELKAGKNVLTMNHQTDTYPKGFSIHHFTLTPVK